MLEQDLTLEFKINTIKCNDFFSPQKFFLHRIEILFLEPIKKKKKKKISLKSCSVHQTQVTYYSLTDLVCSPLTGELV